MSDGPRLRTAWIAGLALAAASSALHVATHRGEILGSLADETLLVPLALREWTVEYRGDAWLELARQVFGGTYSLLLSAVLAMVADPVAAVRVVAFPFQALFLTGSFHCVAQRSGTRAAWGAGAALVVLPLLLTLVSGPGAAAPLAAGAGLPRDLVFSLLPLVWGAFERFRDAPLRGRALGFLVLGILSVIHPLTAVHLVALLACVHLALRPSLRRAAESAFLAVCGAVGCAPYLVQWMRFPRTPGAAPREAMLSRIGGIGASTPSLWIASIEPALWLGAAAWALGRGRPDPSRRTLRIGLAVALAFAAAAPLLGSVVAGIQFDRLARMAVWIAVVLAAVELPRAWAARHRAAVAAAAALAAVGIAGPVLVRAATGADRGPLEYAARRVEVRAGWADGAPGSAPAQRPRPGDPSRDPALRDAFLEVASWCRDETPEDALFLVPPEDWGAFRAYARRPVAVTRKDGGFALSFLGGRGNGWLAEYGAAVEAYGSPDPGPLEALATRIGAGWVVLDAPERPPVPAGWTEVRRAGPYRVVRTGLQ